MNNTNANGVNVSGLKNNDQYILTLEQIAKLGGKIPLGIVADLFVPIFMSKEELYSP